MGNSLSPLERKKALMEKFKKQKALKHVRGEKEEWISFSDLGITIRPEVCEWYKIIDEG